MKEEARLVLKSTRKTLRTFSWIIMTVHTLIMSAFYAHAIVIKMGVLWVNITLLSVSILGFLSAVIYKRRGLNKSEKTIAKRRLRNTKHFLKWAKILAKTFSLGATLYGTYIATKNLSLLSIITGFILVGLWITDVFIEIIRLVFDIHRRRVYEKIKREIEVAKQSKDKAVDNLNRVKNSVKERMKNAKKQLSKSKEENQPNKSLNE
jgi:hypothetical protein